MSELTPAKQIEVPPVTGVFAQAWSWRKIAALMAMFGPAAILASVSIGAGETIMVVRVGAWAGYGLLWIVLLSCLTKGVFVTYLLGRYTAVSGEHIGHRLVRLPGPRGWLLITILALETVGAPLAWVPMAKPCGDLVHHLLRDALPTVIPETIWGNIFTSLFIALALALSTGTTFKSLERQQIIICCILIGGTFLGTLLVRPSFWQTLVGTFRVGYLPSFPPWAPEDAVKHPMLTLSTTFGYVGGSVMSYIVYANWVGIHGWGLTGRKDIETLRQHAATRDTIDYLPNDASQVARLRQLIAPLRWDVSMGALVLFFVTAGFMVSGSAVLYPLQTEFKGWSLLTNQAHIWRNIHPSLVWVYYVTIAAAIWGTLQALPEIYARVSQEFLQAIRPERTWDYNKVLRFIIAYIFIVTMTLVWSNVSFEILTQVVAFLITNLAIALIGFAAIYLNFKLPPAYRTRPIALIGGILSALLLLAAACVSGWGLVGKILGA
jgi:Mn2+/Fe2+ NRAMP family transporter